MNYIFYTCKNSTEPRFVRKDFNCRSLIINKSCIFVSLFVEYKLGKTCPNGIWWPAWNCVPVLKTYLAKYCNNLHGHNGISWTELLFSGDFRKRNVNSKPKPDIESDSSFDETLEKEENSIIFVFLYLIIIYLCTRPSPCRSLNPNVT